MLLEFNNCSDATVATKNICDVYLNALDVRKCQRWFLSSDSVISIFPTHIDQEDQQLKIITILRVQVEANLCQTIEELLNALNQPWPTIQEHLQQIGKPNRVGFWVPHNLSEENRANRSTTCNLLLQRNKTEPFFDLLITADENGSCMIIQNARDSGSLRMNRHEGLLSQVYIQKRRFCVFRGVFVKSSILKCLNLEKLLMQILIVNN
ncbi:histone-lysine N-methyltransferase SETMAR [Trichonephila clavipes]|uniref:Histone-lysine N-methyltransferase SETMAR n=1 Tax=Trichonephila clavipes TaxID=2585209 RepID=A0A8X6SBS9_TRICX|nr:histone-lysine N-methyltransferase SETMAR [Trichonephila clavipes]